MAAQQRGDQETIITVLGHLATIHRKLGELDRSAELSHQQQELATKVADRRAESQAVGNLANVTRDQGDLKQAIKLYEQKIVLSKELNEGLALARANVNLSQIYMQQENWAKAIPYAQSALQEFEKAGHTEGIEDISLALVSNRQKVAHYALSQKQYMQARRQFERALDTLQPIGYQEQQLQLLNHISEVCRLQKDKQRTTSYAQQAIALAQNINHRSGELQALLTLARPRTRSRQPSGRPPTIPKYSHRCASRTRVVDPLQCQPGSRRAIATRRKMGRRPTIRLHRP